MDFFVELWSQHQLVGLFTVLLLAALIASLVFTYLAAVKGSRQNFLYGLLGTLGSAAIFTLTILVEPDGRIPGEAWVISAVLIATAGAVILAGRKIKGSLHAKE